MGRVIEYTKDQRDNWYFSDGYTAPAHIAVHHLAALRKRGCIVERNYTNEFQTLNPSKK